MFDGSFLNWAFEWMRLARYPGPVVRNVDERIEEIVELWDQRVPGRWRRGEDPRLLRPERRYCRGNYGDEARRRGEHAIEYELLQPSPTAKRTSVMGASLVDGVNAVPLARDPAGGRAGNVEADMLLLVRDSAGNHRLEVVEVKVTANDAWFAAVENLRQLRLLKESTETRRLFVHRQPALRLSADLPFTGLVVAPRAFYSGRGKRGNAVAPTEKLLERMRPRVHARLGLWETGAIKPLSSENVMQR